MKERIRMRCPMCDGDGKFYQSICYPNDLHEDCDMCRGKGVVNFFRWLDYKIGELRQER